MAKNPFGALGRILGRITPPGTAGFVKKAAEVVYKGLTPTQRTELDVQLRELELKEKRAVLDAEVSALQILDQSDARQSMLNAKSPGPRDALMWILACGIVLPSQWICGYQSGAAGTRWISPVP